MEIKQDPIAADEFGVIKFYSQSWSPAHNKVVIQEIQSRLYLSDGGFWTPDVEMARTFDSCAAALEETTQQKLQNVQVLPNR